MAEHGRYSIGRKIAEGGMAEIYLGTQHGAAGFERPVVIKRIHAALSANSQFRNMFIDEAHIAMSLAHGNVVQVLDLGMSGGRYFIILELVDGWDLNRVLARAEALRRTFPPELGLYVTAEVCRALSFAHGRAGGGKPLGIVHRDVSPQNILLSEQGEVKLADFGIATAESRRERTLAGTVKGKIGFMSPEQASGSPLDSRSDLFSLGATLYVMATGKRPFAARSDLESLLRTQAGSFPPPEEARPGINPEVQKIILRAMEKDPAARFQSAHEMLLEVERVLRQNLSPAGKTELRQFLVDLHAQDGDPPTRDVPHWEPSDGSIREESLDGSVIVLNAGSGPTAGAALEVPATTVPGHGRTPTPGGGPAEHANEVTPVTTEALAAAIGAAAESGPTPAAKADTEAGPSPVAAATATDEAVPRADDGPKAVSASAPHGAALEAHAPSTAEPDDGAATLEEQPGPGDSTIRTALAASRKRRPTISDVVLPAVHERLVPPPEAVGALAQTREARLLDPGAGTKRRLTTALLVAALVVAVGVAAAYYLRGQTFGSPPATVDASADQEPEPLDQGPAGDGGGATTPTDGDVVAAADDAGPAEADAGDGGRPGSVDATAADEVADGPGDDRQPAGKRGRRRRYVPVLLDSKPPGARVRVGKRRFGPTPTTVRFRSGVTYVLTFSKKGYLRTRKRIRITHRPNQTVRVWLKKRKKRGWWPW